MQFDLKEFDVLVEFGDWYSERISSLDSLPSDDGGSLFAISSADVSSDESRSYASVLAKVLALGTAAFPELSAFHSLIVTNSDEAEPFASKWSEEGRLVYDGDGEHDALFPPDWIRDTGYDIFYAGPVSEQMAIVAAQSLTFRMERNSAIRVEIALESLVKHAGGYSYGMKADAGIITGGSIDAVSLSDDWSDWSSSWVQAGFHISACCLEDGPLLSHDVYRRARELYGILADCAELWGECCERAWERCDGDDGFKDSVKELWRRHHSSRDDGAALLCTRRLGELIGAFPLVEARIAGVPIDDIVA